MKYLITFSAGGLFGAFIVFLLWKAILWDRPVEKECENCGIIHKEDEL